MRAASFLFDLFNPLALPIRDGGTFADTCIICTVIRILVKLHFRNNGKTQRVYFFYSRRKDAVLDVRRVCVSVYL